jgi:hypothetical protein
MLTAVAEMYRHALEDFALVSGWNLGCVFARWRKVWQE